MSYPITRLQDVYVRFGGKDLATILSSISADWRVVFPNLPFDHTFMNDNLKRLYIKDQNFSAMFKFFATVAICIACLGLYGLISQDILYRVKEVGIRKVMGASILSITSLLLKQFIFLVIIAGLVAWPLSYFLMDKWMREFAYHSGISWLVFPMASITVLLLSVLTVSYLSIKAATANPVKSLRSM